MRRRSSLVCLLFSPTRARTNAFRLADACGNPGTPSGTFTFNGLITTGLLTSEGAPLPNIAYTYDNCTETPFLYDPSTNTMISYDDTRSMAAKGAFIVEKNMLGFSVWHVAGDSRNNLLTTALWESMGIVSKTPESPSEVPQEGTPQEGTPAEQKY
jgi:GH18 family chitinase